MEEDPPVANADDALQMIHILLHLFQRTINILAGAMPQRMDARPGTEYKQSS